MNLTWRNITDCEEFQKYKQDISKMNYAFRLFIRYEYIVPLRDPSSNNE